MNWDQSTWDSGFWDQPSDYFNPPKPQNNRTKMKRQVYYPSRIGDQVSWPDNYSVKLPIHGPTLGITAGVNDAKYANYALGTWLSAARNFSPSTLPMRWMMCSPAAAPWCCPPSPRLPCPPVSPPRGSSSPSTPQASMKTSARYSPSARPKCANTACASGTKAPPTATGPMW